MNNIRIGRRALAVARWAFVGFVPLIVVLIWGPFLEKENGTAYAHLRVYATPWFTMLWVLPCLTAFVGVLLHARRLTWSVGLLHIALGVMALGALITRLTGLQGAVHLRQGQAVRTVVVKPDAHIEELPFTLCLEQFDVRRHAGSDEASDYVSVVRVEHPDGRQSRRCVSLNRVGRIEGGWRFYASSFDSDERGSRLLVNHDPVGTGVTYTGYALLALAFVGVLLHPRGRFLRSLKHLSRFRLVLLLATGTTVSAQAHDEPMHGVVHRTAADAFASVQLLDAGRVQPFGTFAAHWVRTLTGQRHYRGFTNEQVVLGWMFFPEVWQHEPLFEVKGRALRRHLGLKRRCALSDLFAPDGTCRLDTLPESVPPAVRTEAQALREKVEQAVRVCGGHTLRLFPVGGGNRASWYASTDSLPPGTPVEVRGLTRGMLPLLGNELLRGHPDSVRLYVEKFCTYQQQTVGTGALSARQVHLERLYNRLDLIPLLAYTALATGLIGFPLLLTGGCPNRRRHLFAPGLARALRLFPGVLLPALCVELGLRTVVCGHLPLTGAYETLLVLAAILLGCAIGLSRPVPAAAPFGTLLAGFCLLVSTLGRMDTRILHPAPILHSPLLGLHVFAVMAAYALLSLLFVSSLTALFVPGWRRHPAALPFAHLLLFPALALLAAGIFLGAVWANQSWGSYWSWDPKENWALITLFVYAVPAHPGLFGALRRPRELHLYLCLAFVALLMTYAGVNLFLGGLHSYA